jgi:spore germination protein YaaH
VNIDFEDLNETTDEFTIDFQKDLSEALHKNGFILTQDVSPFNEDYNYKELSKYNDLIFLMAYDQHNMSSKAGPISSIDWVENALDESLKIFPQIKLFCVWLLMDMIGQKDTKHQILRIKKQ